MIAGRSTLFLLRERRLPGLGGGGMAALSANLETDLALDADAVGVEVEVALGGLPLFATSAGALRRFPGRILVANFLDFPDRCWDLALASATEAWKSSDVISYRSGPFGRLSTRFLAAFGMFLGICASINLELRMVSINIEHGVNTALHTGRIRQVSNV